MQHFLKIAKLSCLVAVIAVCFSSCMTTRTSVGGYDHQTGNTYTYAKGKQVWLLYGLIPIGRTKLPTPSDGTCQVITRFNITDYLINSLTYGIVVTQTIKVEAKRK